jgi:hypothetical protein
MRQALRPEQKLSHARNPKNPIRMSVAAYLSGGFCRRSGAAALFDGVNFLRLGLLN